MKSPASIITVVLALSPSWGTAAEATMPIRTAALNMPADSQGIVIEGPAEVTFHRQAVGRPIQDRSNGAAFDYFGSLPIEGKVQIHTPAGKQYQTWFRFEKRLTLVVKDLNTHAVQRSSYVGGGWNLARQGVSVVMAPHPEDAVSEAQFNTFMDSGKVISRQFSYQLDDHLPTLYGSPTTLEIHAEYLNLRSNKIRVKVHVQRN